MRIAIDISSLETGHKLRGIGSYTKNLVESLQKYEIGHSYSFFTRGKKIPKNVDVAHYPHFDPFFLTLPIVKPIPTVVTVHDLIPLVFPSKFPRGVKGTIKWHIQKLSLGGAKRIITDSKNSKMDIIKFTDRKNIDVVYLAPDLYFQPAHTRKKPYILYVGDVNWNKNIPSLITACASQKSLSLVLVGDSFMNNNLSETKNINSLIQKLNMEKRIIRRGYISNKELAVLYQEATALVQPSFYEGFGLPVLEAMACGCPVISTKNSSLGEIAGPAISIETNPESIASALQKIESLDRPAQIKKQLKWVSQFTWKKTAHETVASYEKTINHHTSI